MGLILTIVRFSIESHNCLPFSKNIPFLENVCCNTGLQDTISYFSREETSIPAHNLEVYNLSNIDINAQHYEVDLFQILHRIFQYNILSVPLCSHFL